MTPDTKQQGLLIAIVIAVGMVLAALILTMRPTGHAGETEHAEDAEHAEHKQAPSQQGAQPGKGPRGGKLFSSGSYSLEVTIYETNVEPHFRMYAYQGGKPLAPASSKLSATVERLGAAPESISFTPEADYLKGNAVLGEPHSFKVSLQAQHGGKTHRFTYEQVEARVDMSDAQVKASGIEMQLSAPAVIRSVLQLNGEIALNADRTVQVSPRLAGVVESVHANAGQRVRKGQLLAVLSSQALAAQRGELRNAQQRLALARTVFEREQKLWQEKISAEQDVQQARAAMNEAQNAVQSARAALGALGVQGDAGQMARHELRAPIAGMITDKQIAVGASVGADTTVFVVADLSTVWAEVNASERELATLQVGQLATVMASASQTRTPGKVSYISALVGEQTRMAKVRVVLPNAQVSWRAGSPVRVEVVAAEATVPVAVRAEAIQSVRDAPAVFGRYGEQFEARPVKLGRSDGQYVEVLAGLGAGVKYAAKNSFLIKADVGKSGASHDH